MLNLIDAVIYHEASCGMIKHIIKSDLDKSICYCRLK